MPHLILASGSPRRQELIRRLVSTHSVVVSDVEERGSAAMPDWEIPSLPLPQPFSVPLEADPRLWAWRKAIDATKSLSGEGVVEACLVLGADTLVVAPGEALGKPSNDTDARRMLSLLRGRDHYVITGFALLTITGGKARTTHVEAVVSQVTIRHFSQEELESYIATGEHRDKAGAYAVQGLGGRLVERVEGCITNVIGLPLCAVRGALLAAGVATLRAPGAGYCEHCALRP